MQYTSLKPYVLTNSVIFPPKVEKTGKNVCMVFLSENGTFLEEMKFIPTRINTMRYIFVPTFLKPVKSIMSMEYKKQVIEAGYIPRYGFFKNIKLVAKKNFILDFSEYLSTIESRYRIKKYNMGRPLQFMNSVVMSINNVPSDEYERVLFYSVDINKYISPNIRYRKIFPIYVMLSAYASGEIKELPFDKLILHFHDHSSSGRVVLLFDKNTKINIARIRTILMKLRTSSSVDEVNTEIENTAEEVSKELEQSVGAKDAEKIKNSVVDFIKTDGEHRADISPDVSNHVDVALKSVLYNRTGDIDRAKKITDAMVNKSTEEKIHMVKQSSMYILPKEASDNNSTDSVIKISKPDKLNDGIVPKHILNIRKTDFKENLATDILDAFKILENKPSPIKVKHISVKTVTTPASELRTTIKDRYNLTIVDEKGKQNIVTLELPHLTDNGSFMVNGQEKVLVNQIVTYPIFFFKPYTGRFISSYSSVQIHSKMLARTSYLMAFMASYKFPLILYLAYKQGFEHTLEQYGVQYKYIDKKTDTSIRLPDGRYIEFTWKGDVGYQLVESFRYSIDSFPKEGETNLLNKEIWRKALEKHTGNRNCIYLLDQVWENVVTPVERRILDAKGDPTDISGIIRYISGEVVTGRVDDRNAADKQRIRTSEIFTALVQKQIYAAYNEYEAKKQAGDPDATLYINPTKTFSEVINSQNVQSLENINPLEELGTMTKISPIGIGGLPDKSALPLDALNIHDTYYGNIDPLETPTGQSIGVQQQLTVGACITNVRGLIYSKDRKDVKPTDILSCGPAMIPFVESNDGCRVLMAAGQSKQAVPIEKPEMPMIQSGYESMLTNLLSDNFIKKCPEDGIVVKASPLLISIKDEFGKLHHIDTKPIMLKSGQGKNGLSRFTHLVKVGDKVKKGQILSEGANITNGMITNGVNVLCGLMPWKGYNFEDGMVVCESLAKKFTSLHMVEEKVYLKPDEDVSYIAKLGDDIDKGGILLTYSSTLYDVESLRHLRVDGGTVVNIEVYSNVPEEELAEHIKPIYMEFKEKYMAIRGSYPVGSFREKGEKIEGVMIKFTLQQSLSLMKGDKLNNRFYNKGVTAIIVPDDEMPVTPWGEPLQMLYNPLSVINRMNTGQLCEMHTSMISRKLGEYMLKLPRDKFIEELQKVMFYLDGTDRKQYSSNLISGLKAWPEQTYNEYREKMKEQQFFPLVFPPFKSPSRHNILKALEVFGLKTRYSLYIPEYKITTDPVTVGYLYVMKLEHMAAKKMHARSIGPYVSRTLAPTAGKKREGGQTIGELDMMSLLGWGCPTVIDEFFGPLSSDHVTKNQMISEIIQKGITEYKPYRVNPVKDLFSNMMLAIHLESS